MKITDEEIREFSDMWGSPIGIPNSMARSSKSIALIKMIALKLKHILGRGVEEPKAIYRAVLIPKEDIGNMMEYVKGLRSWSTDRWMWSVSIFSKAGENDIKVLFIWENPDSLVLHIRDLKLVSDNKLLGDFTRDEIIADATDTGVVKYYIDNRGAYIVNIK